MAVSNREISNILGIIRENEALHAEMVLATVVDVEGSAYRRTGARMLIQANGKWTGSISGGCLEGNALRRAREVIRLKQPQLVTYDTRNDENAKVLGASLGCNGVIQVWMEPLLDFGAIPFLGALEKALLGEEAVCFARELEGEACGKFRKIDAEAFEEGLHEATAAFGRMKTAVEILQPALRLMIFGAGDDARPLCQLAQQMGWRVTVADECKAKTLPVRFPEAEQVLCVERDSALAHLKTNSRTVAVLLSHNYGFDLAILNQLLPLNLPYVGMLGPRKRFDRMDAELGEILAERQEIHAPIGLDIGAQTPFEIALAIVAEIQAKMLEREGGFLKNRKGSIHPRKPQHA